MIFLHHVFVLYSDYCLAKLFVFVFCPLLLPVGQVGCRHLIAELTRLTLQSRCPSYHQNVQEISPNPEACSTNTWSLSSAWKSSEKVTSKSTRDVLFHIHISSERSMTAVAQNRIFYIEWHKSSSNFIFQTVPIATTHIKSAILSSINVFFILLLFFWRTNLCFNLL